VFESQNFIEKMATLERRHEEVGALLGTAEVINKRAEFMKLSREHAELDPLVAAWKAYEKLVADLAAAKQMVEAEKDPELRDNPRGVSNVCSVESFADRDHDRREVVAAGAAGRGGRARPERKPRQATYRRRSNWSRSDGRQSAQRLRSIRFP